MAAANSANRPGASGLRGRGRVASGRNRFISAQVCCLVVAAADHDDGDEDDAFHHDSPALPTFDYIRRAQVLRKNHDNNNRAARQFGVRLRRTV